MNKLQRHASERGLIDLFIIRGFGTQVIRSNRLDSVVCSGVCDKHYCKVQTETCVHTYNTFATHSKMCVRGVRIPNYRNSIVGSFYGSASRSKRLINYRFGQKNQLLSQLRVNSLRHISSKKATYVVAIVPKQGNTC